ncbi:HNH endonuclease [Gordonia tangerina]|uniref:HNH endonuclease n=1 Tax=Gordonia tangerina TaxID=2911060 RepID=A0ABS9DPR0_9ACTN|nr:HNH endonuclease [Gordonia tangerina]MCF3939931.1 HNH endonuclease [Gordonia tangerina]
MTDNTRKPVSKRLRYEVLRRDNHQCRYCGGSAPDVALTVDHVVPVALGGSNDPSNLVAACKDCNAGKTSSSPDAPLVDEVAADALRWAKAIEIVTAQRASARDERRRNHTSFLDNSWHRWTYGSKNAHFDLPNDWRTSVDGFLASGLDLDDLDELVDVAMESRSRDPWKYFCGCCWRRIEQVQNQVAEMMAADEVAESNDSETVTIQTWWTPNHVGDLWIYATETLADRWGAAVDDVIAKYSRCVHSDEAVCGDPVCTVSAASRILGVASTLPSGDHVEVA